MEVRTNRLVNVEQRVALPSAIHLSSQRTSRGRTHEAIVDLLLDRPFLGASHARQRLERH
jgi:hypothetical protein